MTPCLTLEDIGKSYARTKALGNVSLTIEKGEFICFVGPSGCGKTTLLRVIAGLETPDVGRVFFDGRDVTLQPTSKRDFGIVFQSYALFPNMTAARNVAYGLVGGGKSREEIDHRTSEVLALVGLTPHSEKFPAQLSGGQQQRVALARALAPEPGLLLLDEPLSALDAKERERLREELRILQGKLGVTTIMVTHDQDEALAIATLMVVMNEGQIEQIGKPEEVYSSPRTRFVADFIGEMNWLPAIVETPTSVRVGQYLVPCQPHSFGNGVSVELAVRPEMLSLDQDDLPRPGIGASVLHTSFRGSSQQIRLKLDQTKTELLFRSQLPVEDGLALVAGDKVSVAVMTNQARVFPAPTVAS